MTFLSRLTIAGLVLALPFAAANGAAAEVKKTKVGISAEPYPPFTVPDAAGNWGGWEIETMQAVCEAAELSCEVVPVSWDGIIPALKSGKIDMIFGSLSITPSREKEIDFSDKYFNNSSVIVGQKTDDFEPTVDGLSGKVLGVQRSTNHATYANAHFSDTARIKVYQTQDEANQDLISGRIDATQADGVAMWMFLNSAEGEACCEMKGHVEPDDLVPGPGIAAGIRKGNDALREKVNAGIAEIRENGTYQEITNSYFDFDIYGED